MYWKLEVVDANGAQCPKGRSLSLRIRSADFMGSSSAPVITYPVDIVEPKLNEVARLRVKFIQGTNTFLNRRYSEWLLEERLND